MIVNSGMLTMKTDEIGAAIWAQRARNNKMPFQPPPHKTRIRVGHAYAEYADYAHMRNMRMRIENLIHIFHIQREKISLFKRQ